MNSRCASGKRGYSDYGSALDALIELEQRSGQDFLGSCYQCSKCGAWYISKRRFTIQKRRGRGKSRRGVLEDIG
jgi:hypothetical protein